MRSEQAKSARSSRDTLKKRSSISAPISLEDLMDKEVLSSSQDGTVLYVRNKSLYAQKLYILCKVAYRAHKPYNLRTLSLQEISTNQQDLKKKDSNPFFPFLAPSITSIMCSEQAKSARSSRDTLKKRSITSAPISLEDLMDKEVLSSSQDGTIRELSVLSDPSNEQSTKIKQKIRILDHPKNLIEVLRARLAIEKGLIGNAITTGPN